MPKLFGVLFGSKQPHGSGTLWYQAEEKQADTLLLQTYALAPLRKTSPPPPANPKDATALNGVRVRAPRTHVITSSTY
jgi:hypothetical protein